MLTALLTYNVNLPTCLALHFVCIQKTVGFHHLIVGFLLSVILDNTHMGHFLTLLVCGLLVQVQDAFPVVQL